MDKLSSFQCLYTEYTQKSYAYLEKYGFVLDDSLDRFSFKGPVSFSSGILRSRMGTSLFGPLGHRDASGYTKLCIRLKNGTEVESEWTQNASAWVADYRFPVDIKKEDVDGLRVCFKTPFLWFFHPAYAVQGSYSSIKNLFFTRNKSLVECSFFERIVEGVKVFYSMGGDWFNFGEKEENWTPPPDVPLDFWYFIAMKESSSNGAAIHKALYFVSNLKNKINLIDEIERQKGSVHWSSKSSKDLVSLKGNKTEFSPLLYHYKNRVRVYKHLILVYFALGVSILKADPKAFYNSLKF